MRGGCVLGEVHLLMAMGTGIKGLQVQPVWGGPTTSRGKAQRGASTQVDGKTEGRGDEGMSRVKHLAGGRAVSCRPGVHSIGCKAPSSALTAQRGEVGGTA